MRRLEMHKIAMLEWRCSVTLEDRVRYGPFGNCARESTQFPKPGCAWMLTISVSVIGYANSGMT